MRTQLAAAAAATAALLSLSACSSNSGHDDDKPTTKPTATHTAQTPTKAATTPLATPPTKQATTAPASTADTAALIAAVKTYSTAYFAPDAHKSYSLLSKRCQAKITPTGYALQLQQAVITYGPQKLKTVRVDSLSGSRATVTYAYANPLLDQKDQAWTEEGGAWRYDAC